MLKQALVTVEWDGAATWAAEVAVAAVATEAAKEAVVGTEGTVAAWAATV